MGTYDTRGGEPQNDPAADYDPPCPHCGGSGLAEDAAPFGKKARELMRAWSADGSLPTWNGTGNDLQANIERALRRAAARELGVIAELFEETHSGDPDTDLIIQDIRKRARELREGE